MGGRAGTAGDHAASFTHYQRGNRLRQEVLGYRPGAVTAEVDAQIRHCGPALLAAKAGSGSAAADPIFIVGLPRAGSTLLEQILASHSMVEGTTELPDIMAIAARLNGRQAQDEAERYPAVLAEQSVAELTALGEHYLAATRIHRRADTPFFIDKMPNNFRHIGLIHLILPNARIMVHQPSASYYGQAADIARHAQEIVKMKHRLNEIYAKHTGQTVQAIEKMLDRDTYMTAEEAKNFGLLDQVMVRRPEGEAAP